MISVADFGKKEVTCISQPEDQTNVVDANVARHFIDGVIQTPEVIGGIYYIDISGKPITLELKHIAWKPVLEFVAAWTTGTDFHLVNENRLMEENAGRYISSVFHNPFSRALIRFLSFLGVFRNKSYKDFLQLVISEHTRRNLSSQVRQ